MQYSLEMATQYLDAWRAAELAISTGQSYTIGTRSLTRVNMTEVRKQIAYWENQIDMIVNRRRGGARAVRIVPRDL